MRNHPDNFYIQSAVIPYRIVDGRPEVLLIRSRRNKRWVVPKGIVEADLSPAESAAKEAWEEAGIEGPVDRRPLGVYRYKKWGGICSVTVYPMTVTVVHEEWLENFRRRRWFAVERAASLLREPALAEMVCSLPSWIGRDQP